MREATMAKKSEAAVKEELKRRLEEIEVLKEQARRRGLAFASPDEEELARKIRGDTAKSPYFYYESWTSGTTPGSPAYYEAGYSNPDPGGYYPTFVTIFFGLANFAADIGAAVDGRDIAWPYVSAQPVYLAPGATGSATFNYTTPAGVLRGTYLGNAVLWRASTFDVGTYFDRAAFEVTLN
jgi:hypothetical protein